MTARMVLEAGIALAHEAEEKEEEEKEGKENDNNVAVASSDVFCAPPRAGILTPAAALGNVLIDRLRNAGFTFEIEK